MCNFILFEGKAIDQMLQSNKEIVLICVKMVIRKKAFKILVKANYSNCTEPLIQLIDKNHL